MIKPPEKHEVHKRNLARFRESLIQISENTSRPVFVKVGANDGITGDPCTDILIKHANWTGLMIEPVPFLFARLKANFAAMERFQCEQTAVGPTGESTFYYIDSSAKFQHPDLPDWFDQIGSFDPDHIAKHFGDRLNSFIQKVPIKTETLTAIFSRNNVHHCHLLHIDTEGYDFEAISTLDFTKVRPELIFIEHVHLQSESHRRLVLLLQTHGYMLHDCGRDYFAKLKAY
jgi:FkbM family methyltransferase